MSKIFRSQKLRRIFAQDLAPLAGSVAFAERLLADSLGETLLEQKVVNAPGHAHFTESRKLVICPSSHSFALFQPMLTSFLRNEALLIRVPSFPLPDLQFIGRFAGLLAAFDPHFLRWTVRGSDFSDICAQNKISKVEAFGTNDTLGTLKSLSDIPFEGHGSCLSLSITTLSSYEKVLPDLVYDAFCLRQRGCRSSLGLLIVEDSSSPVGEEMIELFHRELLRIDFQQPTSLELALLEPSFRSGHPSEISRVPLIKIYQRDLSENYLSKIHEILDHPPLVFPFFFLKQDDLRKLRGDFAGAELRFYVDREFKAQSELCHLGLKRSFYLHGESQKLEWET